MKVNPIWTQMIYNSVKDAMKICTHCKRASVYQLKRPGQYYKCRYCGHKFKEKGK
jgi:DNA-directed RNA polymerase subunit RPC12/RpoP